MKPKERITAIREEITELMAEANGLIDLAVSEERDPTEEEAKRVTAILGDKGDAPGLVDGLQVKVDWWEGVEAKRVAPVDPHGVAGVVGTGDVVEPSPHKVVIHATARRYGPHSLKAFRGTREGVTAEERSYRMGMYGLSLLAKCLPNRYSFPRADEFCRDQLGIQNAAHGSQGGSGLHFGIPDEFSSDIIDLKEQRGVVRQLFEPVSMSRDTLTQPRRVTGMTTYAKGEGAAGTESNMTMDDVRLVAETFITLGRINKEANEDNAINFGDVLAREIAYSQADKEDEAGFNGDGTSTYGGVHGARLRLQNFDNGGTDSIGLVTQGTGTTWGAITIGDFDSVVGILPEFGDGPDTTWVCHRTFFYTVMHPLILALGGVSALEGSQGDRRPRPIFLGYPVTFSQVFPKVTAVTTVSCLLGDFSMGAMFGDRRDLAVEFDDTVYVNGQSVWEREQVAVKGTSRWDINVHSVGDATNAGAIVGLETGT